jgi:general secretion pathway protein G
MSTIRRARELRDEGFTLIELLIVIIILGVLAGIVVFAVGGITDRGVVSACKSDFKTVETAQEAFYAKSNPAAYAADVTALQTAKLIRSLPSDAHYKVRTDNTGAVYSFAPGVADGAGMVAANANATYCDAAQ